MHVRRPDGRPSYSASPAPSSARKGQRESDKLRRRNSNERRISSGEPNGHTPRPENRVRNGIDQGRLEGPKQPIPDRQSNSNAAAVDTNADLDPYALMRILFNPVRDSLTAVRGATKEGVPNKNARAKLLRVELVKIGDFVKEVMSSDTSEGDRIEESFWYVFTALRVRSVISLLTRRAGDSFHLIGRTLGPRANKFKVCTSGLRLLSILRRPRWGRRRQGCLPLTKPTAPPHDRNRG